MTSPAGRSADFTVPNDTTEVLDFLSVLLRATRAACLAGRTPDAMRIVTLAVDMCDAYRHARAPHVAQLAADQDVAEHARTL